MAEYTCRGKDIRRASRTAGAPSGKPGLAACPDPVPGLESRLPAAAAAAAGPAFNGTGNAAVNQTRTPRGLLLLVFAVAVIARMPALRTWWCLDDWGQLAGAAGLAGGGGSARWVSQHLYWDLTWPLFGLHAGAHAVLRLALHGLAAVTVSRIGLRCGLAAPAAVLAGLLFGAGPVSFTPVYWASGIQELLGGTLSLVAVASLLAGGRRAILTAGVCGVLAVFAKESAFGLPFFLALLVLTGRRQRNPDGRRQWALIAVLLAAVAVEAYLVLGHFAHGADDAYATGGLRSVLGNLAKFGWWLATPLPIFTARITATVVAGGALVWCGWAVVAGLGWRRRERLPALALVAAVLSLAAALPLVRQTHPYLGYTAAAAGALTLASLLPRRATAPRLLVPLLGVAAAAWGWWGMETRIGNLTERGWPADPVVRAVVLSREASGVIRRAGSDHPAAIVLLQPPVTVEQAQRSAQGREAAVFPSARWTSLGGDFGPRLLVPRGIPVRWTTGLADLAPGERVLCESAKALRDWGGPGSALFYAAVLDLGLGHFDRAARHLERAVALGADPVGFRYDEALSGARGMARQRLRPFDAWLAEAAAAGRYSRSATTRMRQTMRTLLAP